LQSSLDELKDTMNLAVKKQQDQDSLDKPCRDKLTEEKVQKKHTQALQKCRVKIPGWQSPGFK